MATIKVKVDDVVEPYTMPADSECELTITDVREGTNKSGMPYLMPRFEVDGEVAAKEFSYYLGIPDSDMTPKQYNAAAFKYKNFCEAIGVDPAAEQDPEDWVGLNCVAILGVEESEEYGEQNFVRRFVVGI